MSYLLPQLNYIPISLSRVLQVAVHAESPLSATVQGLLLNKLLQFSLAQVYAPFDFAALVLESGM